MPMNELENRRSVGARGSWYAEVDGERLPCVHSYSFKTSHYNDQKLGQTTHDLPNLFKSCGKSDE